MARYFVALLPPDEIQAEVYQYQQYFADHYHSRKALNSPPHITLQPPFEWLHPPKGDGLAGPIPIELRQGLTEFAASQTPISIRLSGFAAFAPRVIYINVLKTAKLFSLQAEMSQYFAKTWDIIDRGSKGRIFVPHMTIAFRDLSKSDFQEGWAEFRNQTFEARFEVAALTLLHHNGKHWEICHNFSLGSDKLSNPLVG